MYIDGIEALENTLGGWRIGVQEGSNHNTYK